MQIFHPLVYASKRMWTLFLKPNFMERGAEVKDQIKVQIVQGKNICWKLTLSIVRECMMKIGACIMLMRVQS